MSSAPASLQSIELEGRQPEASPSSLGSETEPEDEGSGSESEDLSDSELLEVTLFLISYCDCTG